MSKFQFPDNFSIQDELHRLRSCTKRYYIVMIGKNGKKPQWIGKDGTFFSEPFHHKIRFDTMQEAWEQILNLPKDFLQVVYDVYIVHANKAMQIITFSNGDPMATLMLPRIYIEPEVQEDPVDEKVMTCPICNKSDSVKVIQTENGWTIECSRCREEALKRLEGVNLKAYLEDYARSVGDSDMEKFIAERNWNN